jgi:type VII secretion-associated protein (TIGR03931 family)
MLRQAVAEQPRGVFVEFNPTDRRGGRPAVTYREVRVGRDIRWAVVLDGSTRISVGCQSAPGREDTVARACEKAIESAHELAGTNGGS